MGACGLWRVEDHPPSAPQASAINKRDGLATPLDPGTYGRRSAARRGRHSPSARSEVARPTPPPPPPPTADAAALDHAIASSELSRVRYQQQKKRSNPTPNPSTGRAAPPACAVMHPLQDRQGADEMRHAPSRGHGVGMGNSGSDRQPDAIGPNQEAGAISERAFCPQPGRGSSRDSAALVRWSLS